MKSLRDHPTFNYLSHCADAAAAEFHANVLRLFLREGILDPTRAADRAARAFRRRLGRQFGLDGRYLPHTGTKHRAKHPS